MSSIRNPPTSVCHRSVENRRSPNRLNYTYSEGYLSDPCLWIHGPGHIAAFFSRYRRFLIDFDASLQIIGITQTVGALTLTR